MLFRTLLTAAAIMSCSTVAHATGIWCGVFDRSIDPFFNLRAAPSVQYPVVARASKGDLFFIDTGRCRNDFGIGAREFGRAICASDPKWVFIEQVKSTGPSDGAKGWANSGFIRQVKCPED